MLLMKFDDVINKMYVQYISVCAYVRMYVCT